MEEFLRCVYADQCPVECARDVLIAFDRYGLVSLLDRCQDQCHHNSRECTRDVRCSGGVERQTSEDEDTQVPEKHVSRTCPTNN